MTPTRTRSFSVLDRANLKKILAEHKLTSQGLVDPENAKKLGQFAGVDALVLGTIIPKGTKTVSLTAKIITTDTAEVVGAARAEFKNDDTVQDFTSKAVSSDSAGASGSPADPPLPKLFGDLEIRVQSIRLLPGDNAYGAASLTMVLTNTSATITYGVAFEENSNRGMSLSNSRGDEFQAYELKGIGMAFRSYGGLSGDLTDVPPRSAIIITSKSQVRWNGKPGDYKPYRLQAVVYFGEENQGRYQKIKEYNAVLEVK